MSRKRKQCFYQYRNIKGKYFEMRTANPDLFAEEIKEAKEKGLLYRIIEDQLYRQKQ